MLARYFTLTSIAFDLAIGVVGRCTFSTPSRNSAVTFVLSASSGSVKLRRKVPKDRSMRWNFSFLIFLLAFAFSGNAKDAVFDCYPNVILLHFRQVSFEEIPVIILTDINLR